MTTPPLGNTYTASDFYNSELDRLNQKQQNLDLISNSNERLAVLNNSYRKRYAKYVEMLMVLVLAYIIYLGVVILQKNVPTVPVFVVDITIVVLIFAMFIYLFSAFWQLSSRNVLNYDELDLSAYDASGVDVSALEQNGQLFAKRGNVTADSICVGNDCCPPSYVYDADRNVCVPSPSSTSSGNTSAVATSGSLNPIAIPGSGSIGMGSSGSVPGSGSIGMGSSGSVPGPGSIGMGSSGSGSSNRISNFTTLEYSKIENAYNSLQFNSPELKRSPNYQNVTPLKDITKLNVSNF
jgi:hypothetical protein